MDFTNAAAVRSALRGGLKDAMKASNQDAVTALRSALSAIDNAESVPAAEDSSLVAGEHVAGASLGVGSSEVARRILSPHELRQLVINEIDEREAMAKRLAELGQDTAADRLLREAASLIPYVN